MSTRVQAQKILYPVFDLASILGSGEMSLKSGLKGTENAEVGHGFGNETR